MLCPKSVSSRYMFAKEDEEDERNDANCVGHACGHNLICVAGVAVLLGMRAAMKKHNIEGTVVLLGTPGELICLGTTLPSTQAELTNQRKKVERGRSSCSRQVHVSWVTIQTISPTVMMGLTRLDKDMDACMMVRFVVNITSV